MADGERVYICIDLKSFFASVEAVDRGLDPLKTNLVVADPSRGNGAICLAITPAMKELGIKNRCRIFEIPKNVKYIIALPRMKKYMEVSATVYGVYLKYIAPEDIHVYSIDECFIDVTTYLESYEKTPKEFATMLMFAVFKETGICATAGIGTNMFLAKVALDVTAKKVPDHIGYLDENEFKKQIWHHKPITDIWNVGRGIAKRLERYGVFDLYGVTQMREKTLYNEFGINAELLIDHAYGRESCTIKDIQNYKSKSNSISNGQILFENYNSDDALIVVKEMVDSLVLDLTEKGLVTNNISLYVGYSKDVKNATGKSCKLRSYTSLYEKIVNEFEKIYRETTLKNYPIRKLNISLNNVVSEDSINYQIDLFDDEKLDEKEKKIQELMVNMKKKYGKNSVLRGISYFEKSTARKRNKLIGGHNGE